MINEQKWKQYAPSIIRIGISIVFLWFGLNQIFNGDDFLGYLPTFVNSLPLQPLTFILLNGIFEVVFGLLLIVGLLTRISALLLGLHLIGIIISLGYNEIAVRDFGLMIATLSVFIHGNDQWCLSNKWKKD